MITKITKQQKESIAFFEVSANNQTGIVLLADHARNILPKEYGHLGLKKADFTKHIAYDIGIESLTRNLSKLLQAPAVLCGFSRLLIDPNRGENDPTLIRQLSDGAVIRGNYPLSQTERQKRLEQFYYPYDQAIARCIAKVESESQQSPFIISLHSFTPIWRGEKRPWHIGILSDKDPRAAKALMQELQQFDNIIVGDNEPYKGGLHGDTLDRHCSKQGLAHILIEIRQDLIADEQGVIYFANLLAPLLLKINQQPIMHKKHFF